MSGNTTSLYATTSSTGNVTIPSNNNTGLYNTSASPASTVNNNLNVNNLFASGNIYASGTIQSGGNMSTGGSFVAAGNVTAQNFIGNFAGNISGNVAAAGSNTQVQYNDNGGLGASADLTFNNTTNLLSVTGNVAAGYFLGDGSQLTGLPATYGNANVATLLANFGSNTISTTGNVTTGYIFGNGSQLTGVASSYGNANVANYLPTYSGSLDSVNNITASGNIVAVKFSTSGAQGNIVGPNYVSANFFVGDGSLLTNVTATSSYSNSNVNALLASWGSNALSTTGNVTAGYFVGDGSLITNLPPGNYSNANVSAFLGTGFGSNSISTTGNVTATNVTATGNLDVGSFTKIRGSSITVQNIGTTGTVTADIVNAGSFSGNGSGISSITGANVTGTVANATFATSAGSATTATSAGQANYANIANSVSGSNVTGQVANALVAGTVYTAAQPNITSVGNLTSLTVTGDSLLQGNLQVNGNVTYIASNTVVINDKFINVANNAATASAANGGGIGVGPAGAEYATWSFSDANTAWQSNIKIEAPSVTTTGNVTANYVIGDGSLLTNINAGNIVGSYGNANVATFLGNGFGSNTITTTGNVTAGNFAGNGSLLTNLSGANVTGSVAQSNFANTANSVAGANVTGTVANATFATSAATATTAGTVTTAAQPNITSVGTLTVVNTSGAVSAVGNIAGNYILGNGSLLTGVNTSTYSNANVNAHLAAFGSNVISTTGNITGSNVNVSTVQATGSGGLALKNSAGTTQASLGAGGGDNFAINVSTNLNGNNAQIDISPTGTGHVHIKPTGTGAVEIAPTNTGSINNMIIGNVTPRAANVTTLGTTGNIAAAGILTDNYYYANGAPFSGGGGGTYGNANVNTLLAAWGSNSLSTTGNVQVGNIQLNGANGRIYTTGLLQTTNNGVIGGNLTVTGDVKANTSTGYFETVVANTNINTGILSASGEISTASLSASGNVTGGNLFTTNQGALYLRETATNGVNAIQVRAPSNLAANLIFQLPNVNGSAGQYLATNGGGLLSWEGPATLGGSMTANIDGGNTFSLTNINSITGAVVSATGNITGANIIGNGQFLTNLPGANVTGTVANATTAGTVTTNAQPNITSVGTLSSLSVTGNIAATGNITGGNLSVPNTVNIGTGAAPGTLILNDNSRARFYDNNNNNYVDIVYGGPSAVNHTLILPTTVGANGQVLAAANANSTSTELTWVTSTATAGGSNTQIQFNDGTVFAGNANMTFNKITGNVTMGNIVTNTNNMQTVGAIDYPNVTVSANVVPWRIVMGNAYNGSANSEVVNTTPGTLGSPMNSPRLLVADLVTVPNNGMRVNEAVFMNWVIPTANISNNSTRLVASRSEAMVGGSVNNYAITATSPFLLGAHTSQIYIGSGTNANLSAVGNVSVSGGALGMFVGVNTQPGSNIVYSTGSLCQIVANAAGSGVFGNVTNQIAYTTHMTGTPANANITGTTTTVAYYHPPNATTGIYGSGITTGNIARMATTYHAFRNDDDLARTRLGTLERMHYLNANVTSSGGAVTIDKNNGQVQQIYLTEAITGATFTNFAVRQQKPNATFQNSADEVTLIFQQGATPYNITLPSGNTQIRYANGVSTVTGVANTTVMIDVVGVYNYNTSATNYLVTVNPAFS